MVSIWVFTVNCQICYMLDNFHSKTWRKNWLKCE